MCEETPKILKFAWFLFQITMTVALVVMLAGLVLAFVMCLGAIDEAWGRPGVPMFPKQYSAVCPCNHGNKVLTLPARSHDDQETLKKLRKAAEGPPCWGCQEGFPRIFSLDVWFHAKKNLVTRYQFIYLGEEAP